MAILRNLTTKLWVSDATYDKAKPAFERLKERTDYREYGAAPLLGINGGCFIGHGRSNARAIHMAIRRAVEFCAAEVHLKIAEKVAALHSEEARLSAAPGS